MFITKIANRVHRGESGFTLIELLAVMAILAILVGLVLPNFFGITNEAAAVQIMGQHEKMREAVFLYHEDTSAWPTEASNVTANVTSGRQLWFSDNVTGWKGPYIERPILQMNRWGGHWGVSENVSMNVTPGVAGNFTVLFYDLVPRIVAEQVDHAMDDRALGTGAVQFRSTGVFPTVAPPTVMPVEGRLTITIAKQP